MISFIIKTIYKFYIVSIYSLSSWRNSCHVILWTGPFFFFLGIITTYQFPQTIDKAKVYIAGLNQIIFPDKRDKPILIDNAKKTSETIYANSFTISVDQIDYVSFKNITDFVGLGEEVSTPPLKIEKQFKNNKYTTITLNMQQCI